MSLLSGRATLTRYRLLGERKNWTLERLNKLLAPEKAPALAIQRPVEVQYGWDIPSIESEVSAGGHWDMSHCQLEDDYVLRIRIDRKKVPSSLLAELYRQELEAREKEKLSKEDKDEVLDGLRFQLLKQALPQIKYIDVIWQPKKDQVLLFSGGTGDRDLFVQLFRRTFAKELGLTLVQIIPPLMGLTDDDWEDPENEICEGLKNVLPSLYHPQQHV